MPEIKILPPEDYERIAAGEVIECPASVVKELLENAIDAGSDRVQIDIGDGGHKWIRVADNGRGLDPEDMKLAVLPHATSKIKTFDDIEAVRSFGFRGEALPSMASVARLRITSRAAGADEAWELAVQGGETIHFAPAARTSGATVELTYLFFNTPARRKFLKSARSEFGHIFETVLVFAFGRPGLGIRLDHNGDKMLDAASRPNLEQRMIQLLPKLKAARFTPVEHGAESVGRISGVYVAPSHSYHNRNRQYFYLNGRYIKDRAVSHAVDRFFSDRMPRGRFPIIVLNMEMDPRSYDVNVHPTKTEVRFRAPDQVHHLVTRALEATVGGPAMIRLPEQTAPGPEPPASPQQASTSFTSSTVSASPQKTPPPGPGLELKPQSAAKSDRQAGSLSAPGGAEQFAGLLKQGAFFELPVGRLTVLGQIGTEMIVAYDREEVHFIDGHALHERLLYDQFTAGLGDQSAQMLLVPIRVELEPVLVEKIMGFQSMLKDMGFDIEPFGDDSLAIRSAPMALPREHMVDVINEFFGGFKSYSSAPTGPTLARDLATAACKRAVIFGKKLMPTELQRLVEAYEQSGCDLTCPHGRPVAHRIPLTSIKKKFLR